MSKQSKAPCPVRVERIPWLAVLVLIAVPFTCAIYANLSFAVRDKADYRFFPPFARYVNANQNRQLGWEYFHIARSLAAGEGFANPFGRPTGPTAWMPPVFPFLLAGLLRVCGGDRDTVMIVVILVQVLVVIGTGLLVLALARQTTRHMGTAVVLAAFVLWLVGDFHSWFQVIHDCWLILLTLDLLIVGLCWWRPLRRWPTAAGWGLFGGFCFLINPIVGVAWGIMSVLAGSWDRAWPRLGIAGLAAALTLTPWTVRNYLVFGRLIPVKSNLAYELYQSQCLQRAGLIQRTTFSRHPGGANGREGQEYTTRGETAFLDQKREQFWHAVWADPTDFLDRVAERFLGVTLWYVPCDPADEAGRPWALWGSRLIYPLPFLAFLVLVFAAVRERLHGAQWTVMGLYLLYLLPYIAASYYERYAVPLLGVKVLLVIWAADRLLSWRYKEAAPRDPQAQFPPSARKGRVTASAGT